MEEEKSNPKKKVFSTRDIQITELFMARNRKRGWTQCFHGAIFREKDENGRETAVNGNILMPDGKFWSRGTNQYNYGDNIDDIVELRIENKIHSDPGRFSKIAGEKYYHN